MCYSCSCLSIIDRFPISVASGAVNGSCVTMNVLDVMQLLMLLESEPELMQFQHQKHCMTHFEGARKVHMRSCLRGPLRVRIVLLLLLLLLLLALLLRC